MEWINARKEHQYMQLPRRGQGVTWVLSRETEAACSARCMYNTHRLVGCRGRWSGSSQPGSAPYTPHPIYHNTRPLPSDQGILLYEFLTRSKPACCLRASICHLLHYRQRLPLFSSSKYSLEPLVGVHNECLIPRGRMVCPRIDQLPTT